ncbi:hypothetical protein LXL04_006275 [Taraxacum kok-saghyz]
MTVLKNSVNDAVSVNAAVAGEFRDRTTMRSVKVLKEIETDQESNSSSSEDMEFYSPKSVVAKKWPVTMKEVNVSRNRVSNPIVRIRTEEYQIGEDIGECFSNGNGNGSNRVDVVLTFSRPASPLSGKGSSSTIRTEQYASRAREQPWSREPTGGGIKHHRLQASVVEVMSAGCRWSRWNLLRLDGIIGFGTAATQFGEFTAGDGYGTATRSGEREAWRCLLTSDGADTVEAMRDLVDKNSEADSTPVITWCKEIPIKVLGFVWRVA